MSRTSKIQLVIAGDNKGAVKAVQGTEKALGGLQGKIGGLGAGIAGALSVAAVTATAKTILSGYEQQAAAVAKIHRLTGESAEDSSLLAFAAQQSGVQADKASAAWTILAKNIANGKVAAEGITTVGRDGKQLAFQQILGGIADKYNALSTQVDKTALTLRLFGRGGADIGKILAKGSDGIEAYRQKMEDLGLEFSEKNLKDYQEWVQVNRDVQASVRGAEVAIGEKLIPVMSKALEIFTKIPAPVRDVALGVTALGVTVAGLGLAGSLFAKGFGSFVGGIGSLIPGLGVATIAAEALAVAEGEAAVAAVALAEADAVLAAAMVSPTATTGALTTALEAKTAAAAQAVVADEALVVAQAEVASAGAGAAGGLAGAAAAAGPYALAVVALTVALGGLSNEEKHAKENADDLAKSIEAGIDPLEAFRAKLAKTLASADGGFSGLTGSSKEFAASLEKAGVSTDDLIKGLTGSDADFVALRKKVGEAFGGNDGPGSPLSNLLDNLASLRGASQDGGKAAADLADKNEELGVSADDAAVSIAHQTSALERLTKRTQDALDQLDKENDAASAWEDAHNARTDALREESTARAAAVGDSDEYRDAVKQEADDVRSLADAEREVVDRKRSAAEAERDLSQARIDAKKHIEDLAQAEVDAIDAARDSATAAKRAAAEERRLIAKGADSLTLEEAHNATIDAKHKAEQAQRDKADAIAENAAAQRAGIEGDKAVVDAKQKVVDANRSIVEAEQTVQDKRRQVADDAKVRAKIIVDAQARLRDASAKVRDASIAEADAYGDLSTAHHGVLTGIIDEIKYLDEMERRVKVGGTTWRALEDHKKQLQEIAGLQGPGALTSLGPSAPPGAVNADSRDNARTVGDLRGDGRSGNVISISNTTILQGTPTQVRRAHEASTRKENDRLARSFR